MGGAGAGMAGCTVSGDVGGVLSLADVEVAGAGVGMAGVSGAMGVAVSSSSAALMVDVGDMAAGMAAVGAGFEATWVCGAMPAAPIGVMVDAVWRSVLGLLHAGCELWVVSCFEL